MKSQLPQLPELEAHVSILIVIAFGPDWSRPRNARDEAEPKAETETGMSKFKGKII